ncbi:hypothetical protein CRUP_009215 [Coryphaenoides rupestris]|nr:hypothetical protein CRUP_009215 [Coryphaenoides rupestris]
MFSFSPPPDFNAKIWLKLQVRRGGEERKSGEELRRGETSISAAQPSSERAATENTTFWRSEAFCRQSGQSSPQAVSRSAKRSSSLVPHQGAKLFQDEGLEKHHIKHTSSAVSVSWTTYFSRLRTCRKDTRPSLRSQQNQRTGGRAGSHGQEMESNISDTCSGVSASVDTAWEELSASLSRALNRTARNSSWATTEAISCFSSRDDWLLTSRLVSLKVIRPQFSMAPARKSGMATRSDGVVRVLETFLLTLWKVATTKATR